MKKWAYTAFVVGMLVVLPNCKAILTTTDCPPPSKPGNVPDSAVWKGDCRDGYWLEFVSAEREKARFRIYESRRGELVLDADFECRGCNGFCVTETNWVENVAFFESALELNNLSEAEYGPRCRLVPVYPAYQ